MSNQKNILVTGADGQLGMEFRNLSVHYLSFHFLFISKKELSITDSLAVEAFFSKNNIDYCINCAAYTGVDKAETEKEIAFGVNAIAVGNLADTCKRYSTRLIHISTDYVFNGMFSEGYKESDETNPLNVYGASKLEGENLAFRYNDESIIIRTSWVFGSYGKNFVKTMLRLMNEKESISVVNDQFGCPTYTEDLAEAIMKIIQDLNKPGIYHYSNNGITTWYDFALEIKKLTGSHCRVESVSTANYLTPAKRPQYSVLNTKKIRETFDLTIPAWKDSLKKCIALLSK